MRKFILLTFFTAFAAVMLSCGAVMADSDDVVTVYSDGLDIEVNGSMVGFADARPFIDSAGRTMVPVRFVAEEFGYKVDWEEPGMDVPEGAVAIRPGDISIYYDGLNVYRTLFLCIGSNVIEVSDGDGPDTGTYNIVRTGTVTMDTTAVIINDRTYVPLRYVAELLGYKVEWIDGKATGSGNAITTDHSSYIGKWDWENSEPLTENKENWYTYDEAWIDIRSVDGNSIVFDYYHQKGGTHLYFYDTCYGVISGNTVTATTNARKIPEDPIMAQFKITLILNDDEIDLEAYNITENGVAFSGKFYRSIDRYIQGANNDIRDDLIGWWFHFNDQDLMEHFSINICFNDDGTYESTSWREKRTGTYTVNGNTITGNYDYYYNYAGSTDYNYEWSGVEMFELDGGVLRKVSDTYDGHTETYDTVFEHKDGYTDPYSV